MSDFMMRMWLNPTEYGAQEPRYAEERNDYPDYFDMQSIVFSNTRPDRLPEETVPNFMTSRTYWREYEEKPVWLCYMTFVDGSD